MKLTFYCDSGANIHSRREETLTTEYLGLTDEEWTSLPDEEKEEHVKEWMSNHLEWGWVEE